MSYVIREIQYNFNTSKEIQTEMILSLSLIILDTLKGVLLRPLSEPDRIKWKPANLHVLTLGDIFI